MRTIEIPRIGHRLEALELGEVVKYAIDLSDQLDGDTIQSHTYTIYDSAEEDVTADIGKGSTISNDVCTIGIGADVTGRYEIELWFECVQYLPNGVTQRNFKVTLILTIKD